MSSRIVDQIRARTQSPRARLLGGSAVLLTGLSIVTLSNFIYNIAVARYLGPEAYGHTSAVYTLLVLISAVTLSIQILTTKIVAQRPTPEARTLAYREFHRWGWAAGIFVSSLLLLCRNSITGYLNLPGSILIVLLSIGTTFYVPLGARRGYLQGTCSFPRLAGNLVLEAFTRLGGSFLLIQLGLGVPGVIAANSAAVVAAYFWGRPRLAEISGAEPALSIDFRESLQAAVFFAGQVVINNCDIVVVKHFFDSESAGLYAAVAMVGRVVFAFSWSIVNSLFPISAETHSRKQDDQGLLGIAISMVSGVCVLFMLGIRLAPSEVWPHLFGAQFRTVAGSSFRYLLILYALSAAVYCLSVVLIAYEMSHKIANTGWLQLLVGGAVVVGIYLFHSSLAEVIWVQVFMMALLVLFVSVPHFTNLFRGRRGRVKDAVIPGLVKLRRRVTEDEVIAEFLKTDFHAPEFEGYQITLHDLVTTPDLENDGQNQVRRALFNIRHRSLWKQLPADTEWYEGELTAKDLERIRVFPRAQWRRFGVGDFDLTEVTHRLADTRYRARANTEFLIKIDQLRRHLLLPSSAASSVLLIGQDERGPFTILDGNHRMVGAMLNSSLDMSKFRFFCGLSPNMAQCCWYRTNVATLTRYGRHRVWHYTHDPEKELHRILQLSSADPQTLLGDYPLRGQ